MKMKSLISMGLVFASLSVWCQCNLAVEDYFDEKVYLYTEPLELSQQTNEKNKLAMSVGIEGYDNYVLIFELNLKQKPRITLKEKVIVYFDKIKPLTLTQIQNKGNAVIINLTDRELNKVYDYDIVKIDFVGQEYTRTFGLKSKDRAKHVDLIDCLDDKITYWKKIHRPADAPPPEAIYKQVESMPRFPGCEDETATMKEKEECAKNKMLQYIYKNLKYPPDAQENNIEGTVVIQFVIAKDGSVQEANIVRDIGLGCGEAALNVVNEMNYLPEPWTPGVQRGEKVKVLYTIPVRFKNEG